MEVKNQLYNSYDYCFLLHCIYVPTNYKRTNKSNSKKFTVNRNCFFPIRILSDVISQLLINQELGASPWLNAVVYVISEIAGVCLICYLYFVRVKKFTFAPKSKLIFNTWCLFALVTLALYVILFVHTFSQWNKWQAGLFEQIDSNILKSMYHFLNDFGPDKRFRMNIEAYQVYRIDKINGVSISLIILYYLLFFKRKPQETQLPLPQD